MLYNSPYRNHPVQNRLNNTTDGRNRVIRSSATNKTTPLASSSITSPSKKPSTITKSTSPPIINVISTAKPQLYGIRREIPAPYLGPQPDASKGRKTLVLDLDETMVHSSVYASSRHDFILKFGYGAQRFYVLKRPFLAEFLARVGEMFEVVVFTCGEKDYANAIIKQIDPNGVISKILHRDYCSIRGGLFTKDIGKLGRDLKDIIFVDNWEVSFMLQPDNGYKIKDFISDRNDCELQKLLPFLEYLNTLDDVRPIPKKYSEFCSKPPQSRSPIQQNNDYPYPLESISAIENAIIKDSPSKTDFSPHKQSQTTPDTLQGAAYSPLQKKEEEPLNFTISPENSSLFELAANQTPINDKKRAITPERFEIERYNDYSPYVSTIFRGPSNKTEAASQLFSRSVPIHRLW